MTSSLEVSVTLDDVFSVVGAKRVPLAPELAGYLALEIAEGADAQGGDIDPKAVYIAEEGAVALVRPKREVATGNAEASIRAILARLLEASGSQTPALAAASRRKATGNLRTLVEELEAALIPVNRAAGRRALARLAREVKRVTLGVGRNASAPPPPRGPTSSQPGARPLEPPRARAVSPAPPPEEPPTAKRDVAPAVVRSATPPGARPGEIGGQYDQPTIEVAPTSQPSPRPFARSAADVDSLLATFSASQQRPDHLVARELKAMAGLDPTPPPPKSRGATPSATDEGVEALLAMSDLSAPQSPPARPLPPPARPPPPPARPLPPPTPPPQPSAARAPSAAAAPPAKAYRQAPGTIAGLGPSAEAPRAAAPSSSAKSATNTPSGGHRLQARPHILQISTGEFMRSNKQRGADRLLLVVLLVLLVVAGLAIWMLKLPAGFFTGRTAEKLAEEKAAAEAAHAKAVQAQQEASCKASLVISDVPDNAEVLLREGQAPVDVDHMPVGARLEFVATAEGYAPKRAVVPAGAAWDPGPDGKPRFEVAVQLDKSTKPKGDLWPPGEPGAEAGGKGPPGTVHIVSTPRGAELWLLAGLGPDARVDQLPCNSDVDVLVAGPTTLRKRLHVAGSDFAPDPSAGSTARVAKISAK